MDPLQAIRDHIASLDTEIARLTAERDKHMAARDILAPQPPQSQPRTATPPPRTRQRGTTPTPAPQRKPASAMQPSPKGQPSASLKERVRALLAQNNGTLPQPRIREIVRVDQAKLSGVLTQMEKQGEIKRERDPSNYRAKIVMLSGHTAPGLGLKNGTPVGA